MVLACVVGGSSVGQVLNEQAKITASDAEAYDYFGYSVDLWNGVIAIGSYGNDERAQGAGAVYLFDATTLTESHKLLAVDGERNDQMGRVLALSSDYVAVGCEGDDDLGSISGAVYVFDVATGTQRWKLHTVDGESGDLFGTSVAADGEVIVAGSPGRDEAQTSSGAAYLFDATTGAQLRKLLPGDPSAFSRFGSSAAIGEGVIAIGSPYDDDLGTWSGSVYLFDQTTGALIEKIVAPDGVENDLFGYDIEIKEGFLAIGSPSTFQLAEQRGTVFLYDLASRTLLHEFTPPPESNAGLFGRSMSIHNGILAISASYGGGVIYLYDLVSFEGLATLLPGDLVETQSFGGALAMHDGTLVCGSFNDSQVAQSAGSAYTFDLGAAGCAANLNDDFTLDFFDVQLFLASFTVQDPAADWNDDGQWDFADVQAYLDAYAAGCP